MKSKSKHKFKTVTSDLIRFDWAIKRLLRQKANYGVLEGFLSVLLKEQVTIINIKESESNQASATDKFNRVDILVENTHGELFVIEIQNSEEVDYFLRMLYGVSKAIVEHISTGQPYSKIRKVYHINIVYFKLGLGQDYVYYGATEFRGIHRHDVLQLSEEQKVFFAADNRQNVNEVKALFPEYYILCVEDFNDVAIDSLDEWIYFLKNNSIPAEFKAQGLDEARERLKYINLSEEEKRDYDHHLNQRRYESNALFTASWKGEFKGRAEGLIEGETIGRAAERTEVQENMVVNSRKEGLTVATISKISGLTSEQIIEILSRHGLI